MLLEALWSERLTYTHLGSLGFYLGRRVANRNHVSTHSLECVCVCER